MRFTLLALVLMIGLAIGFWVVERYIVIPDRTVGLPSLHIMLMSAPLKIAQAQCFGSEGSVLG